MFVSLSSTQVRYAFRFVISLRRGLMYTHHCRGRTFTPLCSYISLSYWRFRLHLVPFHHPQSPSIFTPQSLSHTFTLPSVPNPRTPLQSGSHYNDILSCPLTSPVSSRSCGCDIATREQMGTCFLFLRYAPSRLLLQSCVSIWDCFFLLSR